MQLFRLAFIICLMLTVAACSSTNNNESSGSPAPVNNAAAQPENGDSAPSDKVKITKEQYNEISNGMSYEEVIEIVGGEGEIISESGEKGSDLFIFAVMYEGKGGAGASANFIFIGEKLETKTQFGLE